MQMTVTYEGGTERVAPVILLDNIGRLNRENDDRLAEGRTKQSSFVSQLEDVHRERQEWFLHGVQKGAEIDEVGAQNQEFDYEPGQ